MHDTESGYFSVTDVNVFEMKSYKSFRSVVAYIFRHSDRNDL